VSVLVSVVSLLGLLVGSFANVCVYRIPRRESIVFPGSHCPVCNHAIAFYDNIPLLSWLILGGRCRHCHNAISWRYPLLELIMAASWGALAWHFGPTVELAVALLLFSLLWVLSFIDLETGLLPNAITYPGIVLGVAISWWLGSGLDAVIGAIAGYFVFWIVARLFLLATGREGMGYGDFKVLAMLGAFMGRQALPFIILVSSLLGSVVGVIFLSLARKGIRAEIPFGPYLAIAGMIWFVWGDQILNWYLGFAGIHGAGIHG